MTYFKRIVAMMIVIAMMAVSLASCDMTSLMSGLLDDSNASVEDDDRDNSHLKNDEEDEEDENDGEKEESTTKKKWPSWLGGGGNVEETSTTIESETRYPEWETNYPSYEEWPYEPEGELEYTLEWNEYGEKYYVVSSVGSWRGKNLEIPSEYEGVPVKKIGYSAFMDARMESVYIHEGIEEIEMWAFGYCEVLSKITLPSTLTYISPRVFTYCPNVEYININSRYDSRYIVEYGCIIDVEMNALHTAFNFSEVEEALYAMNISIIGEDACRGLTNLEYIKIADSVEEIGAYAFYGCSNLTHIDIGNSESQLRYIGSSAFSYCSALKGMYVVGGSPNYYSSGDCIIERATGRVVLGCSNSYIPDDGSITAIGGFAFEGCTRLSRIEIPASVKVIEIAAFEGCSKLIQVTLHEGLETIEQRAFCHDNNLKDIIVPSSVTYIGEEAFRGVPAYDASYDEPEYNYGVITNPDGSLSFDSIITSPDSKIVSMTKNPDGSYTIVYEDGRTIVTVPVSSEEGFSGSYEGTLEGDFGFTTIIGGNGNITYQPIP